ncbi:MAG: KEOPS complex subunit Pcc1 [Thermoplasmata archaeon]
MRKASIRVRTTWGARLWAVLEPEGDRPLPRTTVSFQEADGEFLLEVVAKDTSALRAVLNSYLRWTSTALKMMEEVGK